MLVNEMTFGIEIEATIPAGSLRVGGHSRGIAIPQVAGWKADRDPSIQAEPGFEACEFVSPVYHGEAGMAQLIIDIAAIKALGAVVNASCGLHVHVGFNRTDANAVKRLTSIVSHFEPAIFASTGTKNRERGRWCASIRRHAAATSAIVASQRNRYHILNLGSEHPTVEFRAFSASLNPLKIAGYVSMCLALAERAINDKRTAVWVPKPNVATSPMHRAGEGQTQLTRFFYAMGWTKGRQARVYGTTAGPEALKPIKRALMKMARKYDAQA